MPTKPKTLHYSGEVRTSRMHILPGWAACCYGDKAEAIRREGANTKFVNKVTCKACLKRMMKDPTLVSLVLAGRMKP